MGSPEQGRYQPSETHQPELAPRQSTSLQETLARLEQAVGEIHDSDSFRRYLDVQARFHRYSWGNVALIQAQRPDSTRVAGYVTWKQLGRQVRKGEKAIRIVVPMWRKDRDDPEADPILSFKIGNVFDVSQTDGPDLPEVEVPVLSGEEGRELYGHLEALAQQEGLTVERAGEDLKGHTMGYYQPDARRIVVREAAPLQMTKTLAHELGHFFSGATTTSAENETTAEATAYVVCAHFGLDTGARSFPYVATWSKDPQTLRAAMASIQTVSARMIDGITQHLDPGPATQQPQGGEG